MLKINKIYFLFLLSVFSFGFMNGQTNLVPNPSFETYTACPSNTDQVYNAIPWAAYRNTPDYFNSCGTISQIQVPKNYFGYQKPITGNAYAGFIAYYGGGFDREIIGVPLTTPLTISQKYYISFKVNRCDSNFVAGYSINKLGIRLATIKPTSVSINNTANYYTNTIITDTMNWTKIFGSFIADSVYKHLMIGNFFDDANTSIINDGNGNYGYYFVDDVCLSTDSIFTQNYFTNVREIFYNDGFKVFPNPADKNIIVTADANDEIKIFNSLGEEIYFSSEVNHNMSYINCSSFDAGMYFIRTKYKNQKIIINH